MELFTASPRRLNESSPSESSNEDVPAQEPVRGLKVPTYYVRKNEITALQEEAAVLSKKKKRLMVEKGVDLVDIAPSLYENAVLRNTLQATSWAVGEAQSALSSHALNQVFNPLETYIHLAIDQDSRHHTLRSLRGEKLHKGLDFLANRTRFLDLRLSQDQTQSLTNPNGDIMSETLVVLPFPDHTDVKYVYESLLRVMSDLEFNLWERLGLVSVSDIEELPDGSASQSRYFTTLTPGVDFEKNTIKFKHFEDQPSVLSSPYGIIVEDFVDEDELYPYNPANRLRMDLTAATVVCLSDPTTVSVVRWYCGRFHRPQWHLPASVVDSLRSLMQRCGETSQRALREHLEASSR
ncbi:hypothetical protein Poli38472_012200 [Pythium oligandrum]|uniref:Uncharacterized protein n=1 Tax=Pythium oligandrum TaxID=41045 RepID=A0A8K1CPX9_PYTOL|nr:hypothetical protein Poli38472_012200 [Pythium oligandrum]|eukprot:TMW67084.1 hypothetical protein Poli38472_012200 [Pythium oligandrum]